MTAGASVIAVANVFAGCRGANQLSAHRTLAPGRVSARSQCTRLLKTTANFACRKSAAPSRRWWSSNGTKTAGPETSRLTVSRFTEIVGRPRGSAVMAAEPWDGRYLSVATVKRDGTSTACPVWCAWDDDRLVFRTFARTVKARRLRRNPRVAVAPCDRQGKPLAAYRDGIAGLLFGGQARRAHRRLTSRQGLAEAPGRSAVPAPARPAGRVRGDARCSADVAGWSLGAG